jgi:CRISPR type III-B/RAMP module-associated protein Cmr5
VSEKKQKINTQDQVRAQHAFACVKRVADEKKPDFKKKYSTQCRRLPQLIQQCGLCQTVAFLQSSPKDDQVSQALADFAAVVLYDQTDQSANAFAQKCRESSVADYQWLSRHALHCAAWMKRYAEALLPKEEN